MRAAIRFVYLPAVTAVAAAVPLRAAPPPLEDFAYGLELGATDDPVQTFILPVEIYRVVLRTDLGDMRVFNGSGSLVPHAIRPLVATSEQQKTVARLPVFPVTLGIHEHVDDLTVRVQRSDMGAIVNVRRTDATKSGVRAYLFDASAIDRPVVELSVSWAQPADGFLRRVRVHGSDDLVRWRRLGSGSFAHLSHLGRSFSRSSVSLDGRKRRYLRLTWGDGPPPFVITTATATSLSDSTAALERSSITMPARRDDADANLYTFDLGGPVPADHIRLALPEVNTLAEATLESSATEAGPYERRFTGSLYRVRYKGQELASEAVVVPRRRHRYWRLRIDPRGGGLGGGAVTVEASWIPEQLLFVARGEGPFVLAHGSYSVEPAAFDASTLQEMIPEGGRARLPRQSAQPMRTVYELAGPAALAKPPEPLAWRLYLLWTMLVGGVALLGWMAWRLLRNLNAASG